MSQADTVISLIPDQPVSMDRLQPGKKSSRTQICALLTVLTALASAGLFAVSSFEFVGKSASGSNNTGSPGEVVALTRLVQSRPVWTGSFAIDLKALPKCTEANLAEIGRCRNRTHFVVKAAGSLAPLRCIGPDCSEASPVQLWPEDGRISVRTAGIYDVFGQVTFVTSASATGAPIGLQRNRTFVALSRSGSVARKVRLERGDWLSLVLPECGSVTRIDAAASWTVLQVTLLGD